jgi:hypothetical protein
MSMSIDTVPSFEVLMEIWTIFYSARFPKTSLIFDQLNIFSIAI